MKRWAWLLFAVPAVLGSIVFVLVLVVALVVGRDGDPPDTADLVVEQVQIADADNAYTHFLAATAVLDWPKDLDGQSLLESILDGEKSDPEYVAELLARNEKVFPLIERGLACDICQPPEVHGIDDDQKPVIESLKVAQLLLLKSRRQREASQLAEAVGTCGQLIRLGSLILANPESIIQFMVGKAVLSMGRAEAEQLAASQDATASELAALSEQLARVESPDRALERAFKSQYRFTSNVIDDLRDGKIDDEGLGGKRLFYLFQPNETKQMAATFYRKAVEDASKAFADVEPVDVDAFVGLDRGISARLGPNRIGRVLLALVLPSAETSFKAKCWIQCELAAARLIVACRRYETDHGELPPTLDALVPEYLDAVPVDPFDGKPFRYVRDRGIVYSVDKNLVDSGGSEKSTNPAESEDAVFYIHGRTEKPEPSDSEKDETEL